MRPLRTERVLLSFRDCTGLIECILMSLTGKFLCDAIAFGRSFGERALNKIKENGCLLANSWRSFTGQFRKTGVEAGFFEQLS
jgi:hypothetical protein